MKALDDDASIEAFAQEAKQRKRRCWVCRIPEREVIDRQYTQGRGPKILRDWLIAKKGYPVSIGGLDNHFDRRHHMRDAE